MIFKKLYKTFPLSTNHRLNSARRKIIFYCYRATSIRITFPALPLPLSNFSPEIHKIHYSTPLSNTQYILPPLRYSHLEYHHLRIITLFARNNLYPLKLPVACPPLFPPFPLLDFLPLWFTANFLDFADGQSNRGSKNERVGLFETWIIGWRTVLYIMSGAGRGWKPRVLEIPGGRRELVNEPLVEIFHRHARDPRKIRAKIPPTPSLLDWGETQQEEGASVSI